MAIPKCKYLVRKGEAPREDRRNIFDWSPILAERTEKYEPLPDDVLPEVPKPTLSPYQIPPPPSAADIKIVLASEAIKKLETDDFTSAGIPKVWAIQRVCGFDVDAALRDEAYAFYINEKNRNNAHP